MAKNGHMRVKQGRFGSFFLVATDSLEILGFQLTSAKISHFKTILVKISHFHTEMRPFFSSVGKKLTHIFSAAVF